MNLPRTYFAPGKTLPFHATSLGKVLTCELPEKELDAMIEKKDLRLLRQILLPILQYLKTLKKYALSIFRVIAQNLSSMTTVTHFLFAIPQGK